MTLAAILKGRDGTLIAASSHQTVGEIVALLAANRIGAVPVVDDGRLVGIFSERDIVRLLNAQGAGVVDQPLNAVMTLQPVTASPDMTVLGALSLMTDRRIRHLPVCEGSQLVGFVSIGDLVKYRIDRIEAEAAALRDYIAS